MVKPSRLVSDFTRWGWNARGWSPRTAQIYGGWVGGFERWCKAKGVRSVDRARLSHLRDYLYAQHPTAATRNIVRSSLVALGCYLVEQQLWTRNPATELPTLRRPQVLPKALPLSQARKLVDVSKARSRMVHAIVSLMLHAGLRFEEARTLQWGSVLLEEGWILVRGKGAKERQVPIHPQLRTALGAWRGESTSLHFVFPSTWYPDRPVSKARFRQHVYDLGTVAEVVNLHPHRFRHTSATRMLERGADVRSVQAFLGHADLASTQIYLEARSSRVREAVARLDFEA